LEYSRANFARLRELAGTPYDLFVLDNGSRDGTPEWLEREFDAGRIQGLVLSMDNLGICKGLNRLLDEELNPADYDVVVRFDNDCEVLREGTLAKVCQVAFENDLIVAPKVLGLRNPPPSSADLFLGEDVLDVTGILGGVFMAVPAHIFNDFRYDEANPVWGGDEYICSWWQESGGVCGYLRGWEVMHDTDRHHTDHPEHFFRRQREGGPA